MSTSNIINLTLILTLVSIASAFIHGWGGIFVSPLVFVIGVGIGYLLGLCAQDDEDVA